MLTNKREYICLFVYDKIEKSKKLFALISFIYIIEKEIFGNPKLKVTIAFAYEQINQVPLLQVMK